MAWRVLDTDDGVWHVQAAAERLPNQATWQLTLSFRRQDESPRRSAIWATYPLESGSKSSLFAAADRIGDDELRQVLAQHTG